MTPITKSQRLEIQALAAKAPGDCPRCDGLGWEEHRYEGSSPCRCGWKDYREAVFDTAGVALPAYEAALAVVEAERNQAHMFERQARADHRWVMEQRDALAAKLAEAEAEVRQLRERIKFK